MTDFTEAKLSAASVLTISFLCHIAQRPQTKQFVLSRPSNRAWTAESLPSPDPVRPGCVKSVGSLSSR
uniref:Secreted protein n=1 Tax=Panagrellus redivivus TaxID=6233 RepID=A0A7E4UN21_PANRE